VSADAGDHGEGASMRGELASHLVHRELEHRPVEPHGGITNRELRRVNADCDTADSRLEVVRRQAALPSFVERSLCGERERMRRDDLTLAQVLAHAGAS
jgi:hypothetical protein